jgi:arylsulfatase A-like enzyme
MDYFASTHDLARTLLSMLDVPPPPSMAGVDLSSLFRNVAPPERPFAYGGWSNHHFVRIEGWAYVADNGLDDRRLFHLADDPQERRNMASEHGDVVAELAGLVEQSTGGLTPGLRPVVWPRP